VYISAIIEIIETEPGRNQTLIVIRLGKSGLALVPAELLLPDSPLSRLSPQELKDYLETASPRTKEPGEDEL